MKLSLTYILCFGKGSVCQERVSGKIESRGDCLLLLERLRIAFRANGKRESRVYVFLKKKKN